jgi:hypothetical protein
MSAEPSRDKAIYPPLDVLKPVADGIWIVDSGPLHILGIGLPLRMTVIRLSGGDLLLHSPTRCTEALRREIEAVGRIRHLIAPDIAHWMFVKPWQDALPDAVTWAAPGLRERRQVRKAGIRIDHDLTDTAPAAWTGEIEQAVVRGVGFAEVDFLHKPTRTLVLTDLIENLDPDALPVLVRPLLRMMGMLAPGGRAAPIVRFAVGLKRNEAALAVSRLLSRHPERVIFAHGTWFDRDGEAKARRALRWLLP